ncbi:opioid-binding protein/cell adhesion molecule-like [Antedon mediterranea]|uniref:opioid-binding protein/cell adhesion molecule-like n=1 Tax=Antedon mediterranea TaxID=105859 RepID=UPI003AF9029C
MIIVIAGFCSTFFPVCEMYTFRIEPLRTSVMEGETVTLVCEIANTLDDEEYILIWKKDETTIAQEHSILGPTIQVGHHIESDLVRTTSGFMYVLKINPVTVSDGGVYTCLAEERMKVRTFSKHASLIVNQLPGSQYPKCLTEKDGGFPEGQEVTLTCVSEIVTPPVTLKWTRNGQVVPSRIEKDLQNSLIKTHYTFVPKPKDNGDRFTCTMTSSAIKSKSPQCDITPLVVLHKPIITIRRYSDVIYVGKESVYICESTANPTSTTYKWNVSSQLTSKVVIDDNTYQILRLLNPSLSDEGCMLTCVATNSMGTSSSSVTLHLQEEESDSHQEELTTGGVYDNNKGHFLGVPVVVAVIGLTGAFVFFLFLAITPVCYCCLCGRPPRLSPNETVIHQEMYSDPKDFHALQQVQTSDDVAHWMRSVASQVPEDCDVHYSEIDGRPMSFKFPKCSCV